MVIDTLVIGAGLSGLSLAHKLSQTTNGSRSSLLVAEAQGRVGGNITTRSEGEFLWEEGPNSFSPTPELLRLVVEVGLASELVLADRKLPRYVYWQGQLLAVPMSPPALVQSRLLSPWGKIRALLGGLGFVTPAMGSGLQDQGGEETVSQFFQRHLGTEVLQRLVEPFVSGVYAGDSQYLELRAAFGRVFNMAEAGGGLIPGAMLIRGQAKSKSKPDPKLPQTRPGELGSFRWGLAALPQAIATQLGDQIKLHWQLTHLSPTAQQTYQAEFLTPEGQQQVEARTVVLTTPAHISAEILRPLSLQVSQALMAIPYPPVACVVLAYPTSALNHSLVGFGNLIPRGQGIQTLGTIWSSSLFPHRAPQGWHILTSFIGGATHLEVGEWSEDQLVARVHQDLCRVLLNGRALPKVLAVHLWGKAIPQYILGHCHRLNQINQGLQAFSGLYLCSNYSDGVALGDCVRRGFAQADEVQEYLRGNRILAKNL
ncbi:MAG: protoporphyrinogen oxidase [Microcoleaceae cyanobacterium]